MNVLLIALIGLVQALIVEIAKKTGIKKEYLLTGSVILIGIGIATFQQIYGTVVFEEVAGFMATSLGFATALYMFLIKPIASKLQK